METEAYGPVPIKRVACERCDETLHLDYAIYCARCGAALLGDAGTPTRVLKPFVPEIGAVVDRRYRLDEKLGSGGMAVVMRGTRLGDGQAVAIKFLHRHVSEDEEQVSRFLREAKVTEQLDHPNIVQPLGRGIYRGSHYFAMEFIEGETLKSWIGRRHPVPIDEAVALLEQIAQALHHAHEKGIVHRDVKPQNIMIGLDGTPKILDFGLAALRDAQVSRLTRTGMIMGTGEYMAPEQFAGRAVDRRADIYAFGVLAFELLTGQLPFPGSTIMKVAYQHAHDEPPSPRSLRDEMPRRVEAVILRCLEKDRRRRFATLGQLLEELSGAGEGGRRQVKFHVELGDRVVIDDGTGVWDVCFYTSTPRPDWLGRVVRYGGEFYEVVEERPSEVSPFRRRYGLRRYPKNEVVRRYIDYEALLAAGPVVAPTWWERFRAFFVGD